MLLMHHPLSATLDKHWQVIQLRDECEEEYCRVHSESYVDSEGFRGVRDLLEKYNLRDFAIFKHRLPDGKLYLFLTCTYTGADFDADMAACSAEPRDVAWHRICDPMQQSLRADGKWGWQDMELCFFNA